MRIVKKEIESIHVSFRLEGEHDRHLGTINFRYDPETKKTYMEHIGYSGLTIDDGVAMLKLLEHLAPNLEKAIDESLKEIKNF